MTDSDLLPYMGQTVCIDAGLVYGANGSKRLVSATPTALVLEDRHGFQISIRRQTVRHITEVTR